MKSYRLKTILFLALCCDLGLFGKRLVAPAANIITDFLQIPGCIGTGFSLMFLVIAACLVPKIGCATLLGALQSAIALSIGLVGNMGALSIIGYIVPGIVIDLLVWITKNASISPVMRTALINGAAGCTAALVSYLIVFRVRGVPLLLYLFVASLSGAIFGVLGAELIRRIAPVIGVRLQSNTGNASIQTGKEMP